jgi:hypothetical protein
MDAPRDSPLLALYGTPTGLGRGHPLQPYFDHSSRGIVRCRGPRHMAAQVFAGCNFWQKNDPPPGAGPMVPKKDDGRTGLCKISSFARLLVAARCRSDVTRRQKVGVLERVYRYGTFGIERTAYGRSRSLEPHLLSDGGRAWGYN